MTSLGNIGGKFIQRSGAERANDEELYSSATSRDVQETLPGFLERDPHAAVSMSIFDMAFYAPTKHAVESIIPRMPKGSLSIFDALNRRHFPSETQAVDEVIGLNSLRFSRVPNQPYCALAEFE